MDVSDKLRVVATTILPKIYKYYIEKGTLEVKRSRTLLEMFTNKIEAEIGIVVSSKEKVGTATVSPSLGPIPHGSSRESVHLVLKEMDEIERTLGGEIRAILTLLTGDLIVEIVKAFGEAISKPFCEALKNLVETSLNIEEVRFIPFGRTPIVLAIESASREPLERSHVLEKLTELYPVNLSSYVRWTSEGRRLLLEGELDETREKILALASPLVEGRLLQAGREVIYEDWRGSKVSLGLSSALVEEVSGMIFPILSLRGEKSIVLIEEPEAQLHPQAQVTTALFLASLPSLCCKVVTTTHSDLIAITLSYLAVKKPTEEQVKELLKALVPYVTYGMDELAKQVSRSVKRLNLKIYEFTPEGKVKPVDPMRVLNEEVPSITRVIDALTEWAFGLVR